MSEPSKPLTSKRKAMLSALLFLARQVSLRPYPLSQYRGWIINRLAMLEYFGLNYYQFIVGLLCPWWVGRDDGVSVSHACQRDTHFGRLEVALDLYNPRQSSSATYNIRLSDSITAQLVCLSLNCVFIKIQIFGTIQQAEFATSTKIY